MSNRVAAVYTGSMRGFARSFFFAGTLALAGCLFSATLQGCRSAYVQATVINSGRAELHNIEVDYPSASFGISSLAPGAKFHYRFKIQDAGRMKVEFADSAERSHKAQGPYVREGQQGTLTLTLDNAGVAVWKAGLKPDVTAPASANDR